MKKFAKITAIVLGSLLALLLLIPLALKGKVADIVKREANNLLTATLDFDELNISLLRHFPNASLDLKGLELVSGVAPFTNETIVSADRITIVVNLLSLFGDEGFEVRRVLLHKPLIHGHVDTEGAVNWDVMKPSQTPTEESLPEAEATPEATEPSAFRLALKDVTISEATLRFDNDSTQLHASISPLELRLSGDFSAAQSLLKLQTIASNIQFKMEGATLANGVEIALDASIDANMAEQRFTLSKNTFRVNAIEMMLDGWVELGEEAITLDMRLDSNKIEFRELLSLVPAFYLNSFDKLKADGDLTFQASAKGELVGDKLPAFDLQLGLRNGSFKYAMLPKSVTDIYLSAQVTHPGGNLDATRLLVPEFGFTMAGNTLAASLSASTPLSDLQVATTMKGKVDLGAIKEVYPLGEEISLAGLVTLDVQAAGRMSDIENQRFEEMEASGKLVLEKMEAELHSFPTVEIERLAATVSPKSLTLGECQLQVGGSDLKATGQLSNYLGWLLRDDLLSGRLYLESKTLDLNELLAALPAEEASKEEVAEEPTEAQSEEAESTLTAFEVPKNLDLALHASAGKILFQQMLLEEFTGQVDVHNGTAALSSLKMKGLGGQLAVSGSYSTAQDPKRPQLALQAQIDRASFARTFRELELIRKMVPLFEKTGGDYSMSLNLEGKMTADMGIDYPTVQASGEISSSNIQLGNVPIFNLLTSSLNAGKIQSALEGKLVVVKFKIADGRLTTQPFDLKLGSTQINLSGSTGLDQQIDYTAKVTLPGKVGNALQHLDVKIGGTFTSPKIKVDVAEAAKEAAKEAATQIVNQQIEKLTGSETIDAEIERQAEKLRQEARSAGEKLVAEAEKQKEALVAKASNPIAKLAAEKAGEALVEEARKQADKLVNKAEEEISKLQQKATGN